MAVNKKMKALYNMIFDGLEVKVANTISCFLEIREMRKNAPRERIPAEYAKAYREYWGRYGNYSPMWGWYYASRNGNMDVRYVPHTLYYTKLDQYFNARKLGWGFNDKNYYSKIFNDIKQPKVLVRKINGMLFDADYIQMTTEDAKQIIIQENEVICKPSQESGSGRGIEFLNSTNMGGIDNFLKNDCYDDYVVQALIKQHPEMKKIHSESVNCIRICSILMKDGVHILSAVLRMGVGNSRVDNATAGDNFAFDGMTCGINQDGKLNENAYGYYSGKKFDRHPNGVVFKDFTIPSFDKAVALVKKAHPRIGHFRLVSWDVAIDENGDAVLIEANMRKGGINFHQFNNGPLFGYLTDSILNEVFHKKEH